jgi:hypothetical protein
VLKYKAPQMATNAATINAMKRFRLMSDPPPLQQAWRSLGDGGAATE